MKIKRLDFVIIVVLLISMATLPMIGWNVEATEYNAKVNTGIPALTFWYAPLSLTEDEYIKISLEVNGAADFIFLSASQFNNYKNSLSFNYYPSFSSFNSDHLSVTGQIPSDGVYYIIVSNSGGLNSLTLEGKIIASDDPITVYSGIPSLLMILILVAVIIVIALVFNYSKKQKRNTQNYSNTINGTPQNPMPSTEPNLFCSRCGNKIPLNSTLCPFCGQQVRR